MAGTPIFFFIVEARHHGILGKRLQRQWRDELGRVLGHHGKNFVTLFYEKARQLRGFVSGDRSRYAEDDAPRIANCGLRIFFWHDRQLLLDEAAAQIAFGPHNVSKLLQIFFD